MVSGCATTDKLAREPELRITKLARCMKEPAGYRDYRQDSGEVLMPSTDFWLYVEYSGLTDSKTEPGVLSAKVVVTPEGMLPFGFVVFDYASERVSKHFQGLSILYGELGAKGWFYMRMHSGTKLMNYNIAVTIIDEQSGKSAAKDINIKVTKVAS
jgi:hypothetical protein